MSPKKPLDKSHHAEAPPQLALLGAGAWGTALGVLLAHNGVQVRLWGHEPEHLNTLAAQRENKYFLPGVPFPELLQPHAELATVLQDAQAVLVAVPSHVFRVNLTAIKPLISPSLPLLWASKGFDPQSCALLHEVVREELGVRPMAMISGPSFAMEVAQAQPTAVTFATEDDALAQQWIPWWHNHYFHVYRSTDLIGVQVGGAVKNVLAIAVGIAEGLGLGANARAALITRGLVEVSRLGAALGGRPETLMGLSGLGDLVLTATDNQSRNRRFGLALGKGMDVDSAIASINQVVEGAGNATQVHSLSLKHDIDMPITQQVYAVVQGECSAQEAMEALLSRGPGVEG